MTFALLSLWGNNQGFFSTGPVPAADGPYDALNAPIGIRSRSARGGP
ncbi:hypothetical protein [Streptomyces tritici]